MKDKIAFLATNVLATFTVVKFLTRTFPLNVFKTFAAESASNCNLQFSVAAQPFFQGFGALILVSVKYSMHHEP